MKALPCLLAIALCLPACAAPRSKQISPSHKHLLSEGEKQASPAAVKVLVTGRKMTLEKQVILPGGCWGYIDAVYKQASFESSKRKKVFSSNKQKGPYANIDLVEPGDWLYHINHGYKGVEHSGIFVAWVDRKKKIGLMLSYGGEHRKEPARYRAYDLSSIFMIQRAAE